MIGNRPRLRTRRVFVWLSALTAGWLAWAPMAVAAQPVADVATELSSEPECVPAYNLRRSANSLLEDLGCDVQACAPSVSESGTSPTTKRDSIKNGLLVGAAVAAVLSVFGTKIADCPDAARRCPGTKALGIAITVATGAAIGAGIDALLAVEERGGPMTPTGVQRKVFMAGRVSW